MKDTTAILNIAYPEVEKGLAKNLNKYKKYISSFINSRASILYTNLPCYQMYFDNNDINNFFSAINVDKSIITKSINETYYASISNFNPRYAKDETTIAMLCVIRYFVRKNDSNNLELALLNMAFSGKFYPSIWYGSFPVAAPNEQIMQYVVSNMSNKYDIVTYGTVGGAIKSVSLTWVNTYKNKFARFHDEDCTYLVQQLHNRIRSFMNNIAELYYEANENKEYITYDSDNISEDDYHLANSDSLKLEKCVASTMGDINRFGVNYRICKMASNECVKTEEIKSIIENILDNNANLPIVKEFVTLMIANYFRESKTKDVRDLDFVTYSIKTKPNSKDKYLLRQKEILVQLLMNNSEHFNRRKNRLTTEQAYYRAINAYFAILIQEANK